MTRQEIRNEILQIYFEAPAPGKVEAAKVLALLDIAAAIQSLASYVTRQEIK